MKTWTWDGSIRRGATSGGKAKAYSNGKMMGSNLVKSLRDGGAVVDRRIKQPGSGKRKRTVIPELQRFFKPIPEWKP